VDLDVGAGSKRGRGMSELIGKWVNPSHGSATEGERKDVQFTLIGGVHWVVQRREFVKWASQEGVTYFSLEKAFFHSFRV
jgi:hypothetical protein